MSRQIFVNLPVRDLAKATAFYAAIGAQTYRYSATTPPRAW